MLKSFHSPSGLGLLSTTTFGLVQFLVIALYPAFSEKFQISVAQIILCFTMGSLLFIWSAPFWAKKSDECGRQKILSLGLFGLFISFLVMVILSEFNFSPDLGLTILFLSRLFYGLTASAIVSVVQAWWRDQSGEVTKNMISHSMGLNLGRLFAPLLILLLQGNLKILLWVVCFWSLVLFVLSLTKSSNQTVRKTSQEIELHFELSAPLLMAFFSTVFIGIIHSTLAKHLQNTFNLAVNESTLLTSKALLLSSVFVLISQIIFKRIKNVSGLTLISFGTMSWVLASFLFYLMRYETHLWFAVFFLSLGLAAITPVYLSLIKAGGRAAGVVNSSQTIGLTIGGVIGYLVLQDYLKYCSSLFTLCFLMLLTGVRLRRSRGVVTC